MVFIYGHNQRLRVMQMQGLQCKVLYYTKRKVSTQLDNDIMAMQEKLRSRVFVMMIGYCGAR